jgi:mRNA interferase RelE/StbE
MNSYNIQYSERFEKEIHKIDNTQAQKILRYLRKNIDDSSNPRAFGKALAGNLQGFWRYRVGNYRIICDIQDEECIVLALETAHRKDIYK